MPKFRKKPVEIEAWQFDGSWASAMPIVQMSENISWSDHSGGRVAIETLEGTMEASPGDWIIRGVKGEFYPCKPDIFAVTYQEVLSGPPDDYTTQLKEATHRLFSDDAH